MSKGEELFLRLVKEFLHVDFFIDRGIPNLDFCQNIRPKFLYGLELDIYIPQLKIAFEFQGEQHYAFVDEFYKSNNDFIKRVLYDLQKDMLCKKEGILLVKANPINLKIGLLRRRIKELISLKYGFCLMRNREYKYVVMPYSKEDKMLFELCLYKDYVRSTMLEEEIAQYLNQVNKYNNIDSLQNYLVDKKFTKIFSQIKEKYSNSTNKEKELANCIKPTFTLHDIIEYGSSATF